MGGSMLSGRGRDRMGSGFRWLGLDDDDAVVGGDDVIAAMACTLTGRVRTPLELGLRSNAFWTGREGRVESWTELGLVGTVERRSSGIERPLFYYNDDRIASIGLVGVARLRMLDVKRWCFGNVEIPSFAAESERETGREVTSDGRPRSLWVKREKASIDCFGEILRLIAETKKKSKGKKFQSVTTPSLFWVLCAVVGIKTMVWFGLGG
jgi:hypothetical protein